jgi:predicted Zn-dependent peptidase
MERLGMNEIYLGRVVPAAELAARIDAVDNERVIALAERLFVAESSALVLLGEVGERALDLGVLGALA